MLVIFEFIDKFNENFNDWKIGTPLYMAPELFDNEDHYSAAADVYAFAFLAFEIMTPKEPFENDHKNSFKKMTKGGRPKLAKAFLKT